jgi:hypothetical protein
MRLLPPEMGMGCAKLVEKERMKKRKRMVNMLDMVVIVE